MNKINRNKIKDQINKEVDQSSLENKILKKSLDSNYNLELLEGTNAFYSERYGWTLKRK
ncbi:MAG: hypothetical protein CFH14_00865 [Alphaproteobacteria bacterium MarineAlpha5_Bin4]|nr:MAG: hypothetical protein CFH14_00865 [Alphaproteobacteria bacterium MarineAlpha5_Bin4]|tara:strand:+ start:284 stop:460 length:177 start_codon:yes stop_codon:yes gene_type:complete